MLRSPPLKVIFFLAKHHLAMQNMIDCEKAGCGYYSQRPKPLLDPLAMKDTNTIVSMDSSCTPLHMQPYRHARSALQAGRSPDVPL